MAELNSCFQLRLLFFLLKYFLYLHNYQINYGLQENFIKNKW